jgi:hypothetical protein
MYSSNPEPTRTRHANTIHVTVSSQKDYDEWGLQIILICPSILKKFFTDMIGIITS